MVEWERIPDGVPADFQALDGDEIVGWVYRQPLVCAMIARDQEPPSWSIITSQR
jgi:hypothetical protein